MTQKYYEANCLVCGKKILMALTPNQICTTCYDPNKSTLVDYVAKLKKTLPELLAVTVRMLNRLEGRSNEKDISDLAVNARVAIAKAAKALLEGMKE